MSTYWDSSALVESIFEPSLQIRLRQEHGVTRPHTLAEVFAVLTGNPQNRIEADSATALVWQLANCLDFVELTAAEMLAALKSARKLGIRGGRVHDYFHAVAAEKSGAKKILTLDKDDFSGITEVALEII